ncbi:MAG: hypothetical protein GKR96_13705 [Gammaproteobacteria bacterium]|nr:hypothetical protein [Gammaproteobacteria bacterium]
MSSALPRRRRLSIGSLRCDVIATSLRYSHMLSEVYGAPGFDPKPGWDAELVFTIKESNKSATTLSDTLTTVRTKDGYQIETDPIYGALVYEDTENKTPKAYVNLTVRQPEMNSSQLAYHLWLITNRILLILDSLLLHSAAVDFNGKVNLFCGHKGAGKSTLSVFLAQSGATILAEDHVILRRKQGSYLVSGCTSRMRVTSNTEQFLLPGQLNNQAIQIGSLLKKEFPAEQFFSATPYIGKKPHRLFLNHVGKTSRIQPLSTKEALLKMLDRNGNMYRFSDHSDYTAFLKFLTNFVSQIETYSLELSPDLTQLPRVLEMLSQLDRERNLGVSS